MEVQDPAFRKRPTLWGQSQPRHPATQAPIQHQTQEWWLLMPEFQAICDKSVAQLRCPVM